MGKKHLLILVLALVSACANKNCREVRIENEKANPGLEKKIETAAAPGPQSRVKVFKYDGSKQCGMGNAVAVEQMQKDLTGLHVYSAEKKMDGLMHIQACGTPTGQANVYEIDRKDLLQAKKFGFKEWLF
jgi:hypothetical protein